LSGVKVVGPAKQKVPDGSPATEPAKAKGASSAAGDAAAEAAKKSAKALQANDQKTRDNSQKLQLLENRKSPRLQDGF
jgi:hypothetical protein